ncbi:hypothetical protein COU61_00985 [Candidatus Pacearchaeota archaeon CG10_big_fil_rev_8_21_14_0_10_35_13]|nr:MAG: hypothetical protein COU61_00985 [Candidatus Pacearchaeota archaeon CG10_big_fil_rev_8_21_14_0_10_35_13]
MGEVITNREQLRGESRINSFMRVRYAKLLTTTIILTIIFLTITLLGVVGFYKGWFGESGIINLSPENNYIICENNPTICDSIQGTVCNDVTIINSGNTISTKLCLEK